MRILLLDNYDSFTWNLQHLLEPFATVDVKRNDAITVDEAAGYDRIVLSPGPGLPSEAGLMMEVLEKLMPTHPILGVCLGMQAIVEVCGGSLFQQEKVMHGLSVACTPGLPLDPLFHSIRTPFQVGLYHSWAAEARELPALLRVSALSDEGVIMAVRHRALDVCGLQFHPESVMTPDGPAMIRNWIGSAFPPAA